MRPAIAIAIASLALAGAAVAPPASAAEAIVLTCRFETGSPGCEVRGTRNGPVSVSATIAGEPASACDAVVTMTGRISGAIEGDFRATRTLWTITMTVSATGLPPLSGRGAFTRPCPTTPADLVIALTG